MRLIRHEHAAVTLIEVVVVVGILSLLLALTLASVQRVRQAAARAHCASNLRQLALAAHVYSSTHSSLPSGCAYPFARNDYEADRQIGISWQTSILPYVEQEATWTKAWQANSIDPYGLTAVHEAAMDTVIPAFLCPSDSRSRGSYQGRAAWGLTSYLGLAGTRVANNDGVFHPVLAVRLTDIRDGTSNTAMIGERPPGPDGIFSSWYAEWGACVCSLSQIMPATESGWKPPSATNGCETAAIAFRPGSIDDPCSVTHFWSLHPGGANFAFADGSVHFLRYSSSNVLPALATRSGGETVAFD